MSARSKARKRALDVLYEADVRGLSALDVLADHTQLTDVDLNPYTAELIRGVNEHQERIDEIIATYAQGWAIDRMAIVDRNILRIGAWELLWGDVPDAVAISEAVTLAGSLSTDESGGFVNGILARIKEIKPRLNLD
jgi:transcription antitermination protein NusB